VADVLEMENLQLDQWVTNGWQLRTLHAIRKCRTSALGGHIDGCDSCGNIQLSYNSCRNRHCPTCQGHKREEWIAARQGELLNTTYFHVVFTLPDHLNQVCLEHPKEVYSILFKTAWATLKQFGENPKHLGAKMGMIGLLHTWGQNLSLHPHLHCIVPGGGVSKAGNWKHTKSKGKFLFDVKAMSKVYRAKFVTQLRKQIPKLKQSFYDKLFEKSWVVYAKQPFGSPKNVVEYLGRYSHKIAISNHRIQNIDHVNRTVTFSLKNYRNGGKKETMTLTTKEFVRRFCLHILPKGFTRIRHYGILSSSWKKEKLPILQAKLLGLAKPLEKQQPITQHKCCPRCKKGKLVTLLTFDKRGPPKNWKETATKFLRIRKRL
jgi:cation transport regulator ChaB